MPESRLHCEAYGAVLRTNVAWQTLASAAAESPELLTFHVERVEQLPTCPLRNSVKLQGRQIRAGQTHSGIHIQVDDFLLACLDQANARIQCWVLPQASDEIIAYWLLRQILPIARLSWGNVEMLHAGGVRIGNEAVAFLAPSYTGKSTLVAHFVERGYQLITDDLLVLQRHEGKPPERTWVWPSLPYYRNYRASETLGRYTERYTSAPSRLRVIYVLKRAEPDAPVSISPLPNAVAALELLHQAPYNLSRVPCLSPLLRQRFEFVSNLPLNVHVRRLDVPRSLDRLPEVEASIAADFHCLGDNLHVYV